MTATREDRTASLAAGDWRPQSLRLLQRQPRPQPWQAALMLAILLVHVLAARWFWHYTRPVPAPEQVLMVLEFPPPVPLPPPPPEPEPEPIAPTPPQAEAVPEAAPRVAPPPRRRPPRPIDTVPPPRPRTQATPALQALPATDALRLYGPDGRLRVPDDMLEQIDRQVGDTRVFSYQIPRMDDAKKLFDRPPPITFESTRFDQYWQPDQDALTELLSTLVEKTTREIRIPVPGDPGSTMVCKVSLLAFGGGCGILTPGSDYVGPVDDPATLSPEEDRQCAAWWEQIVGARTQEVWRRTRTLYEAECRKPRERQP